MYLLYFTVIIIRLAVKQLSYYIYISHDDLYLHTVVRTFDVFYIDRVLLITSSIT